MTKNDIESDISFLKFCIFGNFVFLILSIFWHELFTKFVIILVFTLIGCFDLIFKMKKHIEYLELIKKDKK